MNISDANPEDVTLQQVAERAGCTTKTVRRAVQDGQLSRRYVMSARGPQLVFSPSEVERWIRVRSGRLRPRHHAAPPSALLPDEWSRVAQSIAHLQSALADNRSTLVTLSAKLADQDKAVAEARSSMTQFMERLGLLESRLPAPAADDVTASVGDAADTLVRKRIKARSATP